MSQEGKHRRLDQILLEKELITEDQLMSALAHQKKKGGRLGSHLLFLGIIDEAGLVGALADQTGCRGIVLTDLDILPAVIKFVPIRVAVSRKVLPFDYNPEENTLKVACESPDDSDLLQELSFVARGKQISLFVAAELPLINAIAEYYLGLEVSPEKPFLELPPFEFDNVKRRNPSKETLPVRESVSTAKMALIVCDDDSTTTRIKAMLEQDDFTVIANKTVEDAIDCLSQEVFQVVFIKDSVRGSHLGLIDRLRKASPATQVQYFGSCTELLLSDSQYPGNADLTVKNLELFTSLLDSVNDGAATSGGRVGTYANRLCSKMNLQPKDRLIIVNAAYLCDLAEHYYSSADGLSDRRSAFAMTVRLLESFSYPLIVTNILRTAYLDLKEKYTTRLPIEVLGGNIITVVDHFFGSLAIDERLSVNKLDAARRHFQLLEGKLFLPEVVEAFFEIMQEEILRSSSNTQNNQVLLYAMNKDNLPLLEHRLVAGGFRTISECEIDGLLELYLRSLPDMMVLHCSGSEKDTLSLVDDLTDRGVAFKQIPTFVLTSGSLVTHPQSLLDKGIAEVMPMRDRINLLVVRLNQAREVIASRVSSPQEISAREAGPVNQDAK